ncbi:hypothetical protein HUW51_16910 [Adhaeribacter swui]|uniref:Uncharacterized protein n=1 Tax=Adhaeribacter swui TaxID=2086471 RepID=A0A7G7GAY5_9BACT|nr:hypothetical protein [Adhaeribacter swui]QNF34319.1 hypothetical protein HUW51_16910 [Adhaeribacter swui]
MITAIVALVGILLTVTFLIIGLFRNRKRAIKRAALTFFSTILFLIIAPAIERNTSTESKEEKEVVFIATREAPLGGISLILYADSTFKISNSGLANSNNYELKGGYSLKRDTIFIFSNAPRKLLKNGNKTSFLIKKNIIEDIGNSEIVFMDIKENNLK